MFSILLALLLLLASPAQKAQTPAPNPADLCTVQGVVMKADTREPLRGADVTLEQDGTRPLEFGTTTDAMGRFELKDVVPGLYRLVVERNAYVRQEYGQTAPRSPGSVLTLSAGQKISDISVQLSPAAVISGHVYDENGDPVMEAHVTPLCYSYVNGQRQLADFGGADTNDLGEFRLYGLLPGQYFVEVEYRKGAFQAYKSKQGYVPMYYPGVPDLGHAAPIVVRAGDEFSSAEITLQTTHTVTLRGHMVSAMNGGGGVDGQVFLLPQNATSTGNDAVSHALASDSQGAFELLNVPPGAYFLYALHGPERARQPIGVVDTDIEGIVLTLTPGVEIRGRLRIEGKLDSTSTSFRIVLAPQNTRGFYGSVPTDSVKADGAFLLKGAYDNEYEINVSGLPENWFLKSARLDGVDALTAGVTIDTKQAPGLLDILVSPNGATLDGVVSKDQQPFQGATVALVPDPPHRGETRLFKSTSTDQLGHFHLQGIPPGDYKLFAWESIESGAYTNSEFLQPYEIHGESVHITEGSHTTLNPELIPKADGDH
jgi:hypothetical protein